MADIENLYSNGLEVPFSFPSRSNPILKSRTESKMSRTFTDIDSVKKKKFKAVDRRHMSMTVSEFLGSKYSSSLEGCKIPKFRA